MNKPVQTNLHPIGKSLILFGVCLISLLVVTGILLAVGLDTESKTGLQLQTFFGQIGGFLLPVFIFLGIFKMSSVEGLYFKSTRAINWLLTVVLAAFALAIINYLGILNAELLEGQGGFIATLKEFEEQAAEITMKMLTMQTPQDLVINLFLVAVVPAVCEELLFRGILQNLMAKTFGNIHVAIWLTAAIFSAIHFQFFGFIPRMVLGAIYGYLLIYSGSIWVPILAHFLNNAAGVTTYYIAQNTELIDVKDVEETPVDWYWALTGAAVVFGVVWLMKNQNTWPKIQEAYQKFEMFPSQKSDSDLLV